MILTNIFTIFELQTVQILMEKKVKKIKYL